MPSCTQLTYCTQNTHMFYLYTNTLNFLSYTHINAFKPMAELYNCTWFRPKEKENRTQRRRMKFTNSDREISRNLTKNLLYSMTVFTYSEIYQYIESIHGFKSDRVEFGYKVNVCSDVVFTIHKFSLLRYCYLY
jgi:hypothetical protein